MSDDELERWGSVGDEGNGARKLSDKSESGARGIDDGMVVVDDKGSGGGGGGGRFGMGNPSWAIYLLSQVTLAMGRGGDHGNEAKSRTFSIRAIKRNSKAGHTELFEAVVVSMSGSM